MNTNENKKFRIVRIKHFIVNILMSFVSAVSLDAISGEVIPTSVSQDDGSFTFTFELTNTGDAGTLDFDLSAV